VSHQPGDGLCGATVGRPVQRVLFLFLDGVGLAPAGPANPLANVPMPCLCELLGGPLVWNAVAPREVRRGVLLQPLDACLGVPGLPQSATGQTALFTGVNAAAAVGEHVTAHPTAPLRAIIAEHSLLKRAAEGGAQVMMANAHSERFWEMVRQGRRRLGASTLTALAAGLTLPSLEDLSRGQAVLWDITHEIASGYLGYELPSIAPEEAGARLARLAAEHDLVLFESFLTDLAGHGRIEAAWVLERLDRFLGAVAKHLSADTTLVLSSDHGNVEVSTTRMHTTNPVPLLTIGPAAGQFAAAAAITDLAPAILEVLGVSPPAVTAAVEVGGPTVLQAGR